MTKKNWGFLSLILVLFAFNLSITSCEKEKNDDDDMKDVICSLSEDGENGLYYMREEEKLARDVYLFLNEKWGHMVFSNIAKSEQVHMDAVLDRIDFCELDDSALPEAGKFNNEHLQELYDQLIDLGSNSLYEAFIVGMTIEDVDIYDLDLFISEIEDEDIKQVYESLRCGSTKHMKAFNNQIELLGEAAYTPQFITPELFHEIINSENGPCK